MGITWLFIFFPLTISWYTFASLLSPSPSHSPWYSSSKFFIALLDLLRKSLLTNKAKKKFAKHAIWNAILSQTTMLSIWRSCPPQRDGSQPTQTINWSETFKRSQPCGMLSWVSWDNHGEAWRSVTGHEYLIVSVDALIIALIENLSSREQVGCWRFSIVSPRGWYLSGGSSGGESLWWRTVGKQKNWNKLRRGVCVGKLKRWTVWVGSMAWKFSSEIQTTRLSMKVEIQVLKDFHSKALRRKTSEFLLSLNAKPSKPPTTSKLYHVIQRTSHNTAPDCALRLNW